MTAEQFAMLTPEQQAIVTAQIQHQQMLQQQQQHEQAMLLQQQQHQQQLMAQYHQEQAHQQYLAQQQAMAQQQALMQQHATAQQQLMPPPPSRTMGKILCCMCGTSIDPNPSNMCVACIRTQADITTGISRSAVLFQCRQCLRYLGTRWIGCQLESRELLALCLKKIHGLGKNVRLVDAGFVWTEPHSKRIKVRLVLQGEVLGGTILQQEMIAELEIHNQQCPECQRSFTPHEGWKAVVQLRQKVNHKRTFMFLEQLILKHRAHTDTVNVKEIGDGLDFYFAQRSNALRFLDFIQNVVPVKFSESKKLISQDFKSNTADYNYSFSVEIAPVCKDDLVCLPHKVAQHHGSISPLVLVHQVSNLLHLVDPFTLQTAEMNSTQYWMSEFKPIADRGQLVEYTVIDVELLGSTKGRMVLAEVTVVKTSELGSADRIVTLNSHLGALLRPGDLVLGYDMRTSNVNMDLSGLRGKELPDVVLVKKKFQIPKRRKRRVFKLKQLEKEEMGVDGRKQKKRDEAAQMQYEEFLRDLEEDPEMRAKIELHARIPGDDTESVVSSAVGTNAEEDPTFPEVKLEELMGHMQLK